MKKGYIILLLCALFWGMSSVKAYSVDSLAISQEASLSYRYLDGTSTTVNYCEGLRSTFIVIGHLVRLAKILVPIVIILFGMLDFFRAVTAAKEDEIKKSARTLLFRALAGVCIFFLPALIDFLFSMVDGWNQYESNYQQCFKCIWDVGSDSCK